MKSFQKLIIPFQLISEMYRPSLAIELYKVGNRFSPDMMKGIFPLNADSFYNTRNKIMFHSRHIRTVYFGSERLSHLAPKIWELVPEEIKKLESVASFKNVIKK